MLFAQALSMLTDPVVPSLAATRPHGRGTPGGRSAATVERRPADDILDWSKRLAELVGQVSRRWGLTARQRRVLDLVARGKTNKQVAGSLGISERTAELHIHNITVRARLRGRSELLAALLRAALESSSNALPPHNTP